MKKLLVIAAVMAVTVAANAQQAPAPKETQQEARKHLKDELQLTQSQSKDLKVVNETYKERMQAVRNDKNLTREQKKAQVQSINKERSEKVNTILTPEQQQRMNELKKTRMHKKHKAQPATTT